MRQTLYCVLCKRPFIEGENEEMLERIREQYRVAPKESINACEQCLEGFMKFLKKRALN